MSKRTIIYIALALLVAFLISCDGMLGKPDIRKEFKNEENKPDYWGWRWDFKF